MGLPGPSGLSWAFLGVLLSRIMHSPSWAALGLLGRPKSSWAFLGHLGIPGLSWAISWAISCTRLPGPSWALLGLPGHPPEPLHAPVFWAVLDHSGPSWAFLGLPGPSWVPLGLPNFWAASCTRLPGASWALLGSLGLPGLPGPSGLSWASPPGLFGLLNAEMLVHGNGWGGNLRASAALNPKRL